MSSRTYALLAALTLLSLTACAGKDGAAGGSCSVVTNGDGTVTIHCPDGSTGTVGNGQPGTPCTVSDLGGGQKRIDCGDTSATLSDGAPGADGTSCTVEATSATERTITCGGTSVTVADGAAGADGTSCTVTDLGGGASRIDCTDGTSVTVRSGVDGAPGADGASCTASDLGGGTRLISCTDGTAVTVRDGSNGLDGTGARVGDRHGAAALAATALRATGKYPAAVAITAAAAAPGGALTVDFTVADGQGQPVIALAPAPTFTVARLQPPAATGEASQWVPYLYRVETVTGTGDWPSPAGTTALQGARESTGTLVAHGDGSYTYTFAANLAAATEPLTGSAIPYLRGQLHRVALMLGGAAGPTADATFDFVPDGSPAPVTRELLDTAACRACHGPNLAAHGGDRLRVETCVTCHVPGTFDAQGGESLDFKVMIHKIHAGGQLASIPGPDGIVFDNPATGADESADNGRYALWGFQGVRHEWWKAGFPAELANCQKCHQGSGAQVDAWKAVPTRAACGSCHDTVDFATGANHGGGPQAGDGTCAICHQPAGGLSPIVMKHDWTTKDVRNLPEFGISLTVSTPANGASFVAGEAPVVTLQLTDLENGGAVIDHSNLTADASAEGCTTAPCPAKDGLLAASNLFVAGPRARRNPVLTTKARTAITSATIGPFDISAAGATLDVKVDGGLDLYVVDGAGADRVLAGSFSVPVSGGTFASTAAATPPEVVAWLNANAAFRARALAYLEPSGRVSLRSRNLGDTFSLQLGAGPVTTAVFGGNTALRVVGGSTVGNSIAKQANPANNDPKVGWFTDHVTYQLDPVDDLAPGTYVVSVEISDRGRRSSTDYKTPSVGKVTFQVKTAAEELPVARNCQSCHQGPDGRGLVLDFSRHNKILSDTAVDQCGGCHDYQTQTGTGAAWAGANPIARRVHAVHMGAFLNYPLTTVAYANGDPVVGRNWDITYPQDVRMCESCHPAGTTSGTWRTAPGRLACMGCHDSDAAKAHLRTQTWDPTPADVWSGDEQEACKTCH